MRLHHLALLTPDPASLAAWYASTFGLAELRRHTDEEGVRSVWLDVDGVILMVERGAGIATEPVLGWHGVYLAAEGGAREEWLGRLRQAGVEPHHATSYTLYVRDPEGNVVGISAYPQLL